MSEWDIFYINLKISQALFGSTLKVPSNKHSHVLSKVQPIMYGSTPPDSTVGLDFGDFDATK